MSTHTKSLFRAFGLFSLFCLLTPLTQAQTTPATAQLRPALQILDSTKDQDGLIGAVRRVKTEYARITLKEGQPIEGPRQLLEITTYGIRGNRVDNVSYPIPDSVAGREEYKYDSRGNVVEKILRDERGAVLTREAYEYVFDGVGNWTKMITNLVLIENGQLKREAVEVTYRTLTYYATESNPQVIASAQTETKQPAEPVFNAANIKKESGIVLEGSSAAAGPKIIPPSQNTQPEARTPTQKTDQSATESTSSLTGGLPAQTRSAPQVPTNSETAVVNSNGSTEKPATSTTKTEEVETASDSASVAPVEPAGIVPTAEIVGATADRSVDTSTLSTPKKSAEMSNTETRTSRAVKEVTTKPQETRFVRTSVLPSESTKKTESALERQPVASSMALGNEVSSAAPTSPPSAQAFEIYEIGRRQFEAGDVKAAINSYLESLRLEPSSAEVQMNLGHAYLTSRKDKEAMKAFKEAVRLNPELAEGFYGLGFVSFRSKNYKEAMDGFKKAIAVSPNMAKAHYGLAMAYIELEKFDDMIHEYRILQRLDGKLAAKLAQVFPDIRRCEGTAYCR